MIMLVVLGLSASAGRLEITDVDIDVAGEDSNYDQDDDGRTIGDEAKPGDEVEIDIEITSNFTNSDEDADGDEIDIEDIEVTVTIEGIDDGDDIDEELDSFDLGPGDDDGGKIRFIVPEEVGEGDYDITIEVEGEDTNGTTHRVEMTLTLQVEKEKHEVRITRAQLSPEQVKCSRNAQLGVTAVNTGQEDEEDNVLTVTSSALGLSFTDTYDVQEGEFDDDMKYTKTYSFTVPKGIEPDTYPILVRSTYDDGDESVSKTVNLIVEECTGAIVDDAKADEEDSSSTTTTSKPIETTTVVISPGATQPVTTAEVIQPSQAQTGALASTQKSLFDSPSFMVGVIALEVLIVVVGIAFVAYLMRRS